MNYLARFKQYLNDKNTFLCVGIDPDPQKFPQQIGRTPQGVYQFCREIIKVTQEFTPAYKFNLAFFEIWGHRGWQVLERLLADVPPGILKLGDAKRGDIGNSARFYAKALFDHLNFDAVTISPYLGSDSIKPFIEDPDRGAFVLCVTSNPSGQELQQHGEPWLYIKTAQLVDQLNTTGNLGLVMGATQPEQLMEIRRKFPQLPFLIPGVGRQGGAVETAVQACQLCGAGLINVSRSIIFAPGQEFPGNIQQAAKHYANLFKKEG